MLAGDTIGREIIGGTPGGRMILGMVVNGKSRNDKDSASRQPAALPSCSSLWLLDTVADLRAVLMCVVKNTMPCHVS